MTFDWLKDRRLKFTWSWRVNWPDAGDDKCKKCGVPRKTHGKDHRFVEKEEQNAQ